MPEGFVESTKEASVGGYQGIKTIRGVLVRLEKKASKFTEGFGGKPAPDQMEFELSDAAVLEMKPNEEEFELTDGKFTGWETYAAPGRVPHKNSTYMRCWVASAEALGKSPSQFLNEYVTLSRVDTLLFKRKKEGTDETEEIRTDKHWCFVKDAEDTGDIVEHITGLVVGKNKSAAVRALLIDNRAKQYPMYKDAATADNLPSVLPTVKLVDDVFQRIEEVKE